MAFNFIEDLLTSGNYILNDENEHSDDESDFEEAIIDDNDQELASNSGSDSEIEPNVADIVQPPDGILWSDRLQPVDVHQFESYSGPNHDLDPDGDTRPIDYFYLFIKESFFDDLVRETNLYAEQRMAAADTVSNNQNTTWTPVTAKDKKTATNRVPETVYGCTACNTHLCKGQCFAKFHVNLN